MGASGEAIDALRRKEGRNEESIGIRMYTHIIIRLFVYFPLAFANLYN